MNILYNIQIYVYIHTYAHTFKKFDLKIKFFQIISTWALFAMQWL